MSKKKPRKIPEPLPGATGLIDAHTHVTSCPDAADAVIARAWDAGLLSMVTVGDGLGEAQAALELAQQHPAVYAACAIHPTRAAELDDAARAALETMAADPACVAIGETGLDTYWIHHEPERTAPLEVQQEALAWHNDLARRVHKPLMIHNREADEPLMETLRELPGAPEVILHCYSSPAALADFAIERGYYLSFSGNVTFKRNQYLRDIAARMPIEQLLYETDAPYMTPEPYRGSRNEPAIIGHTAQVLAQVRGLELAEFTQQIQQNYARVYGVDLATAN